MVDVDVAHVVKYPNTLFNTEHHGAYLDLPKVVDMADQGQEESELFSRRNAIESSPMSDSTTMDSVVSDSQRNEQQDEKSSPSYLETINTPAIQILDENTNMEFEEETFQQTHTTEKQISIEMTEEQVTDTDIKLQEELMKETGIVYTKTKSLQNDSEIKATFSRESSMDLTEESSNQIADPLPDQLDDAKEDEAMDEDELQAVEMPKVRPLFLGNKIRLGKEVKKLGQLVNERRQKNKQKKAHRDLDPSKNSQEGPKEQKETTEERDSHSHSTVIKDAAATAKELQTTSSAISQEIASNNPIDDLGSVDPNLEKSTTETQNKKKPEKRKLKEGGADETVENPKKKTKKASKWSQHKREQVKLLQEAKLKKKEERQRRERVKERLKELEERYNQVDGKDNEDLEQGDEVTSDPPEDSGMVNKAAAVHIPVLKRYVLEENRETKEVLIEIDPVLLAKLKPHQVEAVRFMYDCCIESVDIVEFDQGGGCILAHCMGLGKTLSVISFVYTLMSQAHLTTIKKSLIVCPLNTVKNWVNEFQKWTSDLSYEIDVYELSNVKESKKRGELLHKWNNEGGVMILGYEMYRNLVQAGRGKVRVQKETYAEVLADPGPDIVICDEGHILKNSKSQSYKAMNRIKTRRRVILTGTPLQNNLKEYYHMVNYVKPLLLSTMKNFTQRFIDPITAGQCKDSGEHAINNMRRRVHVLHKILGGCVQRKDYSALTKFLPPKHEYVISVRMGTEQCELYTKYLRNAEKYLYQTGFNGVKKISGRDARLFRDYQTLMRIWTHPWLLTQERAKKESKIRKSQTPTNIREPIFEQSPFTIRDAEPVDFSRSNSVKLSMDVENVKIESVSDVQNVNTEAGKDEQNIKIEPSLDVQNIKVEPSVDVKNFKIEPSLDDKNFKIEPSLDDKSFKIEPSIDLRNVKIESGMDVQNIKVEAGFNVQNSKVEPGLDMQNMEIDVGMDVQSMESSLDEPNIKIEPDKDVQYSAEESEKDITRRDSPTPPHLDPVVELSAVQENSNPAVPIDDRNDSPCDLSLSANEQTSPVLKSEHEEPSNLSWPIKPDEVSNISDEEQSPSMFTECTPQESPCIPEVLEDWWREHVTEDDGTNMSMSGKIILLFEILEMCRRCKDKLLVFSQSIPSLNLIEAFLGQQTKASSTDTGRIKVKKTWIRDKDYFRIDGTTSAQKRKEVQKSFNDPENKRACLFLISTKAGSLGTNLVAANRVIIFDASWNPAHDIQSIFRVYRFGQVKPVYVYRFLAQGTMEEKIYERQVMKQSLSQRVIDEQQIERHFTAADLQALYEFKPDRLDDPDREERPLPNLPKDELLANLMTSQKQWIVTFHEHDSLLENIEEEELTEEEKKAAWSEYERKTLQIYPPASPKSPVPFTETIMDDHLQPSPVNQLSTIGDSENFPQTYSSVSDLDAWFEKPDNNELLRSLTEMIEEKCPDIFMQGDLDPDIPKQEPPQHNLDTQNSLDYFSYQPYGRDIGEQQPYVVRRNDLVENYDVVQQTSTAAHGSGFATGIRPHLDNMDRHFATIDSDSAKQGAHLSYGVTVKENISDSNVNTSRQLPSVDNPHDVGKTFPNTEPLDLSWVEDLSPINMFKKTRAERDLNTPELIITDEQRSEAYSDNRGWIGDTNHSPKSFHNSSRVNMSYKKPKQRMLERLLYENMDTDSPTSTLSNEQSLGKVSPSQSVLETIPLNLSSRGMHSPSPSSIEQIVPLNLSVRDTHVQASSFPAILTLTDTLSVDSANFISDNSDSTLTSTVALDTDITHNSSETHTLTGDGNQETGSTGQVSSDSKFSSIIQPYSHFNSTEISTLKGDSNQEYVSSNSNSSVVIQLDGDIPSYSNETDINHDNDQEIFKTDQVSSDSNSPSPTHIETTDTLSYSSALPDDDNQKIHKTDQVSNDSSSSYSQLDTDTHSSSSETNIVTGDSIQEIHETDQFTRTSSLSSPVTELDTDTPSYPSYKSSPKNDNDTEIPESPTSSDISDSIKEVNSATDEHLDASNKLNIPSIVSENTEWEEESMTTDAQVKFSFSPIKTSDYEDISDSEDD